MSERVRLRHSIYTSQDDGEGILLAREGQIAVLDGSCFQETDLSLSELLRWKDDIRIRVDGSEEWINVNCWNVEPVD